jgi:hypothetical protein
VPPPQASKMASVGRDQDRATRERVRRYGQVEVLQSRTDPFKLTLVCTLWRNIPRRCRGRFALSCNDASDSLVARDNRTTVVDRGPSGRLSLSDSLLAPWWRRPSPQSERRSSPSASPASSPRPPSIALVTLALTFQSQGPGYVAVEARSMAFGGIALAAYCGGIVSW